MVKVVGKSIPSMKTNLIFMEDMSLPRREIKSKYLLIWLNMKVFRFNISYLSLHFIYVSFGQFLKKINKYIFVNLWDVLQSK